MLGEIINLIRISQGISQEKLAEATGFTSGFISSLEHGRRQFTLETLEAVVKVLNVPLWYVLFLRDNQERVTSILDPVLVQEPELLRYWQLVVLKSSQLLNISNRLPIPGERLEVVVLDEKTSQLASLLIEKDVVQ